MRQFLGGLFGADGHAPTLRRFGEESDDGTLEPPAFSQSALPENVESLKGFMADLVRLLERCGVEADGANVYNYPVRRSESTYPAGKGNVRTEVRLELPDGLSFVERVGYRYCVDKALKASAAAAYWRSLAMIHRQRLWMSARLETLHGERPELSFTSAPRSPPANWSGRSRSSSPTTRS